MDIFLFFMGVAEEMDYSQEQFYIRNGGFAWI
jgi:hypothetical protein